MLFVLAMYVLTGLLHGACDLDVTNPSGQSTVAKIATTLDDTTHRDRGLVADHHCHGCFSVSIPAAPQPVFVAAVPKGRVLGLAAIPLVEAARGLDPPPPKFLI